MDPTSITTVEPGKRSGKPGKRSGKPGMRGQRITVYEVLVYLASGMTEAEILAEFPLFQESEIRAFLAFGAYREHKCEILSA